MLFGCICELKSNQKKFLKVINFEVTNIKFKNYSKYLILACKYFINKNK